MRNKAENNFLRFGLQVKSVCILALVILGVAVAGGWFYFDAARESLRKSDLRYASELAEALAMAVQYDLRRDRDHNLDRLASDFLRKENVRYVAIVDRTGLPVATACAAADRDHWEHLTRLPLTVSAIEWEGDELVIVRPVVMRDVVWWEARRVGAVRIVFDTGETTARLAAVRRQILAVAVGIVLCGLPIGYLLVSHTLVRPIRRLVDLTVRLARGEFHARARIRRSDEVGRLGEAFDAMADDLARMRDELVAANEQLERKVADRTEDLQLANHRLRSEMAEKEQFLRAVSHDLNAPLRNIGGMATLTLMKWRDELPEDVVVRLQRIQANVETQSDLIAELLELSRIRTRPQRRALVDMGELLAGLADTFEFELRSRGIDLTVDAPLPALYVEASRVRQVFQNLIDNAIKYMHREEGGAIRVRYRRERTAHVFAVADNGPGIPADQHEKVFCVFRRVNAGAGDVPGKGVGLALVRGVMSNYDGRAWVESQPGEGATFCVAFDVDNTRPPVDSEEPGAAEPRAESNDVAEEHPAQTDHCLAGR